MLDDDVCPAFWSSCLAIQPSISILRRGTLHLLNSALLFRMSSPLLSILTASDSWRVSGSWKVFMMVNLNGGGDNRSSWLESQCLIWWLSSSLLSLPATCSFARSYIEREDYPTFTPYTLFLFPPSFSSLHIVHSLSYKIFLFRQSTLLSSPWWQVTQSPLWQSWGPHGLVLGSNILSGVPADSVILIL